jgi:hypothetical protein
MAKTRKGVYGGSNEKPMNVTSTIAPTHSLTARARTRHANLTITKAISTSRAIATQRAAVPWGWSLAGACHHAHERRDR